MVRIVRQLLTTGCTGTACVGGVFREFPRGKFKADQDMVQVQGAAFVLFLSGGGYMARDVCRKFLTAAC